MRPTRAKMPGKDCFCNSSSIKSVASRLFYASERGIAKIPSADSFSFAQTPHHSYNQLYVDTS
jgi:hypothetical protein